MGHRELLIDLLDSCGDADEVRRRHHLTPEQFLAFAEDPTTIRTLAALDRLMERRAHRMAREQQLAAGEQLTRIILDLTTSTELRRAATALATLSSRITRETSPAISPRPAARTRPAVREHPTPTPTPTATPPDPTPRGPSQTPRQPVPSTHAAPPTTPEVPPMRRPIPRALLAAALSITAAASAQTFSNPARIALRDAQPASLYPSPITVSGLTLPVGSIVVTLSGVNHTAVGDLAAILVAPDGRAFGLLGECNALDDSDVDNATWTFSVDGTAFIGRGRGGTGSGLYGIDICPSRSLYPPAPLGPYGTDWADMAGMDPNGAWSLYIADTVGGNAGEVSGGWSISFRNGTSFTYQGRLDQAGTPFEGAADLQFRLFDSESGGSPLGPTLAATTTAARGLFAVQLDFGLPSYAADAPRWLEVSVNGQTLTPRQPLGAAPRATFASRARTAVSALTAQTAALATNAQTADTALSIPTTAFGGTFASGLPARRGFTAGIDEAGNSHIELDNDGSGSPYIDFARSTSVDFHARIILSDASTLQLQAPNIRVVGNFINNSDARDKHDIRPLRDALSLVSSLQGVRYLWNDRTPDGAPLPRNEQIGFLAQDVEKVLPELVATDASGRKGIAYISLVPLLTEAIKDLRAENANLRRRLEALEARK